MPNVGCGLWGRCTEHAPERSADPEVHWWPGVLAVLAAEALSTAHVARQQMDQVHDPDMQHLQQGKALKGMQLQLPCIREQLNTAGVWSARGLLHKKNHAGV